MHIYMNRWKFQFYLNLNPFISNALLYVHVTTDAFQRFDHFPREILLLVSLNYNHNYYLINKRKGN